MGGMLARVVILAALSAVVCAYTFKQYVTSDTFLQSLFAGVSMALLAFCTTVCIDILRLKPSNSHSIYTLLTQYIYLKTYLIKGFINFQVFKRATSRCRQAQDGILSHILSHNASTEYGKKMKFSCIKTREEFVNCHPLTTYSHYADYVTRMVEGEDNILMSDTVVYWGLTSGTTGKPKIYPASETWNKTMEFLFSSAYLNSPTYQSLRRVFQFKLYEPKLTSSCGIRMSGLSHYIFKLFPWNIVPHEITRVYQEKPLFYLQALFFLAEKDVYLLDTFSTQVLYSFFKFIENNWKTLCQDIARGSISGDLELDEDLRVAMSRHLKGDPERASELESEFNKGMTGVAKRVWPNLCQVTMTVSGNFEHCAKLIKNSFLKGLPTAIPFYGATECMMGINLDYGQPSENDVYHLYVNEGFFEFIPVEDCDKDQPKTLFAEQLEDGKDYEIVPTGQCGLYRYRVGDVIQVIDAGGGVRAPTFRFKYRIGMVLNLTYERTPENLIYKALKLAEEQWTDLENIVEYTATESFVLDEILEKRTATNYYIIFIELGGSSQAQKLTEEHAKILDVKLCQVHGAYNFFRNNDNIQEIQIVQVKWGTFEGLCRLLSGGKPHGQFKMPRVLRRADSIQYLLQQEVQ